MMPDQRQTPANPVAPRRPARDLRHMVRTSDESADQVRTIRTEPGGELRYIHCLLATMGQGGASSVEIVSDAALPDISAMEPRSLETLDPEAVIAAILRLVGHKWYHVSQSSWRLETRLAASGRLTDLHFQISLTRLDHQRRKLLIERLTPPA